MVANIEAIIRGISQDMSNIPHIVDIRDFNAQPSTSTNLRDASVAINQAIEYHTVNRTNAYDGGAPTILIPAAEGFWYLENPIRITRSCHLMGAGGTRSTSLIRTKTGTSAIEVIADHRDGREFAGGHGSIISHLNITPLWPTQTVDQGRGIYANTQIHLAHITVGRFGNDNICIDASDTPGLGLDVTPHGNAVGTMAGNAVGWSMYNVNSGDSKRNGFRVVGNKAHAGCSIVLNTSGNCGCGMLDQSYYGNTYISPHFGGSGKIIFHGANGTGLTHELKIVSTIYPAYPRMFLPIKIHTADASNKPGFGANWRDYWYEFNEVRNNDGSAAMEVYTDSITTQRQSEGRAGPWIEGEVYSPCGSSNIYHDTAGGMIIGQYAEGDRQGPARIGARASFIGGTIANGPNRTFGSANTSFIAQQGALNTLNVVGRDSSGKLNYFGSDPAVGEYMKWGSEADSVDGTPVVWKMVRDVAGENRGYQFVHQDNPALPLLRFEKNGANSPTATIKRLEDRIAYLESLVPGP